MMPNRSVGIWGWKAAVVVVGIFFLPVTAAWGAPSLPAPKMTYLDNGEVRIGMDLALGGAVTFISGKGHPGNLINSADLGRQIQMSHYSGPWPFEVGDKKPHPAWVGLGWNPIETGDCHLNPSKVVEHRHDDVQIVIPRSGRLQQEGGTTNGSPGDGKGTKANGGQKTLSRNDSVGREVIAKQMLLQAEE
jgi:hypothetical protein